MEEIMGKIEEAINGLVGSRPLPPKEEINDAMGKLGHVVMQTYAFNVEKGNGENAKMLLDAMGCVQVAVIKYPMIIEDQKRKIALLEEAIAEQEK